MAIARYLDRWVRESRLRRKVKIPRRKWMKVNKGIASGMRRMIEVAAGPFCHHEPDFTRRVTSRKISGIELRTWEDTVQKAPENATKEVWLTETLRSW
jgi:hypothetical protein